MAVSGEQILERYRSRKQALGDAHARMAQIREHYKGHISVPLPELDLNEAAATANLITMGLDQTAMRIASVTPLVNCPPLVIGNRKSEENARIRRRALLGWWERNDFNRLQRRRARWLIGYASAPVILRPSTNPQRPMPVWRVQNPFSVYPGPAENAESFLPPDCILAYSRTLSWLRDRYPAAAAIVNHSKNPSPDDTYEVLEWIDADEHVLIVVGKPIEPNRSPWGGRPETPGRPWVELERFPNRIGRCTVVIPTRMGLTDDPQGQFDGMPPLARMQARAMALWQISNERSVFPEVWFVSRPNETVQIIETPDGRAGRPGQVRGGDLKEISLGPPPQVGQMIDVLERNARVTAAISPDFGGENPTNVRTGRAGEQLLGATVDFWVQEAQETLGRSYREENEIAFDIAREYFGNKQVSFYVELKGATGHVDYIPNVNFETAENTVTWPSAGADANNLAISIGQRVGIGEMSVRTAMELDPMISDAEKEQDRITAESLEKAMLDAVNQSIVSGQIGPLEVGQMYELVKEDKLSLFQAFQRVHEQIQQQAMAAQGAGGAQGPPGQPPGPGGGPPSSPGLMSPGVATQLGLGPGNPPGEPVAPPAPSVAHLGSLLSALRGRQNTGA